MANETRLTLVGNLTADPELRFTPGGVAVANFSVASTPRFFNKDTNEWEDAETLFMRCTVWREMAENVAESLSRGMRVVVVGSLQARTWETKEGESRTTMDLIVEEIGPSLRFATADTQKNVREEKPKAPARRKR